MIITMDHKGQGGMALMYQEGPCSATAGQGSLCAASFYSCLIVISATTMYSGCLTMFHLPRLHLLSRIWCIVSSRACTVRMRRSCFPDLSSSDENGAWKVSFGRPDSNVRRHTFPLRNEPKSSHGLVLDTPVMPNLTFSTTGS